MQPFKIIIDDKFLHFNTIPDLSPIDKKNVISLVNVFEEGKWKKDSFLRFIWNNVAETALSQQLREKLVNDPASTLAEAAKKLRLTDKEKDISKGSELAEIILYGVLKKKFNALPVVPKIFYKQNPKDNAKGADSVHIVLEGETDFSLWFGEAKFYNDIKNTRLQKIIDSIETSLNGDKLKKENSIITGLGDLDLLISNTTLLNRIKNFLDTEKSIDELKPKLNIPVLLLHECKITAGESSLSKEYIDKISKYHKERSEKFFEKQIASLATKIHLYSEITFHLILIPVPDKLEIVNSFISAAEFYQNQ